MTWEQALQVIELMQQQMTQLTARSNATDAEHIRVHNELERTQAQLAQNSTTGGRGEFRLIDPKTMIPDKLGTDKAPWKQWAEDTRAYVAMLSPMLSKNLKTVEGRETKLESVDFDAAAVPEHHAAQLSRYLSLRSEGHANTIVKASIERNEHSLETWRCLSWEYDPKGLGTKLIELNELLSPAKLRAKTIAGISVAIEAWEALERRHKERQALELPDKVRISILSN